MGTICGKLCCECFIFGRPSQRSCVHLRLIAENRTNNMNRIVLFAMLVMGMATTGVARDGYRIDLNMPGLRDSMVYLVHYYGKPLPNIFVADSARLNKDGRAVFESKDGSFVGGIYMMLLSDHKTYFEFLLNKGDDMKIVANPAGLPLDVRFEGSEENSLFLNYSQFLADYGKKQQALQKELQQAKSKEDTVAVKQKIASTGKELTNYRRRYVQEHRGTLLSSIFDALEMPQVPEGEHLLADGKTKDTLYAWRYYKEHYWDRFDLQDDRLIHTPVFDAKLEEYINKLTVPYPDSVIKECNYLLKKTRGTQELFKYTLWWLTKNAEGSKVMGMDEVFVYLVENYYMKGDATWLADDALNKYIDRAMKIAPNVIGNLAPEIELPLLNGKGTAKLSEVKAKYTLLVFYAPTCGHCKVEMPAIDSVHKAVLKKKGVKIYAVSTEQDDVAAKDFVKRYKLQDWTTTWDPERVKDWRSKYDVYSTPTIYLLDEQKIIRGKRLDYSNIGGLIDKLEQSKQTKKQKN